MDSSEGFEVTPGSPHPGGAPTDPFPRVHAKLPMSRSAVRLIASEARKIGLLPLRRNHARFFLQPRGYVAFGADIDLVEGKGQRYVREAKPSGNWFVGRILGPVPEEFVADAENFTRPKWLLATDAFRNLPEETPSLGFDGASFFIETDIEGNYSWKCHWGPEDRTFLEIAEIFDAFSHDFFPEVKPVSTIVAEALVRIRSYAQKRCLARLEADHVRLLVQRLGFVESAWEIDLISGQMTKYPGHVKGSVHKGEIDAENLIKLRDLLDSDEFQRVPAELPKWGDDGLVFFLEVDRQGAYWWKCLWEPDARVFLSVARLMEELGRGVVSASLKAREASSRKILGNLPNWSSHWVLAYNLKRQGRLAEAISHLEEARRLEPKDGRPLTSLGELLVRQGRVQEAIQCFKAAIKLTPNYPESVYGLGTALAQAGRTAEAEDCLVRALRTEPKLVERRIQTGNELLRLGKAKEAIPYYQQVLRIKPEYSQVHYNLGRALEQVDRKPEAIEHYNQALNCRPDFTSARIALARLKRADAGC